MGNPFVVADSGRVPSLGDLYFAVWVCRQDYHSVLKGLHNGTFVKDIKWLKLVSFLRNTELAKIRMAQYIIAAGKPPNIWQSSSKDSKKMTMPYLLWLKFQRRCGYLLPIPSLKEVQVSKQTERLSLLRLPNRWANRRLWPERNRY
jgi:hypothetical protein